MSRFKEYIEIIQELKLPEVDLRSAIKSMKEAVVEVDANYFRPTEVDLLIGDATKSRTVLNWIPEYDLKALVVDMMRSDVKLMKKETYLKEGGFRIMNYFE
jgi:GDPmannose 4,6-dehydratase